MVSCSVTEYASSASSLTEYSSRHVLTRYRPSLFTHRALVLQADFEYRKPYRHAEIGQQIPGQLYAAVAEVLAWVWQLKRWRLAGGQRPVQPTHLPVPEALDFINEKPTHE